MEILSLYPVKNESEERVWFSVPDYIYSVLLSTSLRQDDNYSNSSRTERKDRRN